MTAYTVAKNSTVRNCLIIFLLLLYGFTLDVQKWTFRIGSVKITGDEPGHGAAPPLADLQVVAGPAGFRGPVGPPAKGKEMFRVVPETGELQDTLLTGQERAAGKPTVGADSQKDVSCLAAVNRELFH